ncbi:RNA 2',3'-cyclic phosphodiesterase [Sphingomicrobium sp. XHP0239]|uniref:RNA 2',3'-cyclic phosphodiesterase n=1 Tax=Sphingomicrobium maritimum TaxID=3133972 RepID=UPI0031CC8A9B
MKRETLEKRWSELTREELPACAAERGWPIRFDHCFQRVLLDNAVGTSGDPKSHRQPIEMPTRERSVARSRSARRCWPGQRILPPSSANRSRGAARPAERMRLFVAFACPEPLVDTLAPAMEGGPPNLRWMPEEQLHCTLRFIGEVGRHEAEDIAESLSAIHSPSLDVRVAGVGQFEKRRGGALWARLAPKAPLEALHDKIDRAIQRCGLPPERRAYLPHVTLARWSGGSIDARAWAERWAGLESASVPVDGFDLVQSRLFRDGPQHETIASVALGAHPS